MAMVVLCQDLEPDWSHDQIYVVAAGVDDPDSHLEVQLSGFGVVEEGATLSSLFDLCSSYCESFHLAW